MPISEERLRILKANNTESNLVTRTYIKSAFLALLNEKGYDDIRMTDIIRRSGVSRSAVYKNYKSKDGILFEIYKEPINEVLSGLGNSVFDNLELAFRSGKKHESLFRTIIDAGLEHRFLDRINDQFVGEPGSFYVSFWNGMIYNAFMEWTKGGMKGTVEETMEKVKQDLKMVAETIDRELSEKH